MAAESAIQSHRPFLLKGALAASILAAAFSLTACGSATAPQAGPSVASSPDTSAATVSSAPRPTPASSEAPTTPAAEASAMPSWAKSYGIPSMAPDAKLTAVQTCEAYVQILSVNAPPYGSKDYKGYWVTTRDEFAVLRAHAAPETQADVDAIWTLLDTNVKEWNPAANFERGKAASPHITALLKRCAAAK